MLLRKLFLILMLALPGGAALAAGLEVVTTTSSLGMLAREVGAEQVRVTVLAPPGRDIHTLQARPSLVRSLRRADLLVAVGADLEVGWLPAALAGAANPAILPGRAGHFEAAAHVELLDAGRPADRALGDVHPAGNPHLHLDPLRMGTIARALAMHLGRHDPAHATLYRDRAAAFAEALAARLPGWQARAEGAPGVVLYHESGNYLLDRLGVPLLGYVEPVPGVPPTPGHLRALVSGLEGQRGVVLYHGYQPADGPAFVARALGWTHRELPLEPPLTAQAADYFALIDAWVAALAQGARQ